MRFEKVVLAGTAWLLGTAWSQEPSAGNWYLSGRVLLEDGTKPSQPVTIEAACNGTVYVAARTDKRGEFSFRLGLTANRGLQDATVGRVDGAAAPCRSKMIMS